MSELRGTFLPVDEAMWLLVSSNEVLDVASSHFPGLLAPACDREAARGDADVDGDFDVRKRNSRILEFFP